MTVYTDEKLCKNHCPQCGAGIDDVEWGPLEADDPVWQKVTCTVCECEFQEVFKYACTVYDHKPVREFYPDERCPDCGEDINKAAEPGDSCYNCDHVFNYPKKDDG